MTYESGSYFICTLLAASAHLEVDGSYAYRIPVDPRSAGI